MSERTQWYRDEDFVLGEVTNLNALLGELLKYRGETEYDRRRAAYPDVYVWDERPESAFRAHHDENGAWVRYYCRPVAELLRAYGPWSLSCLKVIPWHDSPVRMFGEPRDYIGSTPLAFQRVTP